VDMGAVITLTTDFGLSDAYVAAMKGVILGINPSANLVDICHTIKPQDVSQAAFVLGTVYRYFPRHTVHLVVVDPGVGTERKAIILRTPEADFVAPDNGVLSYVIQEHATEPVDAGRQKISSGSQIEVIAITESKFWLSPVSNTFHGRDIFAPVAAHLSLGTPLPKFGEKVDSLAVLPLPQPRVEADGTIKGTVLHIDTFGNLITSIKSGDLPESGTIIVEVGKEKIHGLSRTYGSAGGLMALIGSSDYLEISLVGGSAGDFLKADIGDEVSIRYNP
jgi:S-adenosylmethionine hydrolase